MIGHEMQRKLQIDQREVLAAAARQRGADAIERFGSTGLRRIHQRRHLLATLGLAQPFQHQRVPRELLVERLVDGRGGGVILVARQPASVGFGDAQHGIIELVGTLEAGAGVLFLAREVEHHAGVQVLEDRIPLRAGELVDAGDGRLGVAGAIDGPAGQQRCHQVGDRPADRLVDIQLRGGIFLQLEILHADDETRDPVGFIDGEDALGKLDGLVDVAVSDRGDERPIQQLIVLRIAAQRREIKGRRGVGVALDAGVTGGQIAARRGQRSQIIPGRKLCRVIRGMIGRLRANCTGCRQRGESEGGNGPAIETS